MKNIHYYFIIAILSLIIGLLNIDFQSSKDIYDVRLDEGYISSSKTLSSNTSIGNNLPMNSVFPTNSKPVGTPINVHPVLKQDEHMSAAFEYSLGDARLIGEAGSMREDVALSINPIESNQLPPLNQGMVNVTGDNTGYRMLPKGMVFKNDIDIILPYDTTLLPIGFTPNDIKTYYYDERFKRWIEIERDSVDETNQLVISKVNHFTDFINAILKTPEMPETSAYAPTQMNDIKAANPLEGMTMIQPPSANNNGSTSMSFPITIAPGRQGMQPNLALSYNGGTSSSWLGVGWDISIPSITIETRWGVPRYDQTYESELYLYNGEQLVTKNAQGELEKMPHRTNQWKQRGTSPFETQYYPRVNEAFDSIVRHGYSPSDYWWSVTDRNGITNYYGKMHDSDNIDTNAILTDENGNIAHWALTETRDVFGNTVRYYYSIDQSTGLLYQDVSVGKQIYIDSINYTGFIADTGYVRGVNTVVFRRVHDRTDASITANLGFKRVDDARLCNIHMVYGGPFVDTLHENTHRQSGELITRSYHFVYSNSYSSNFKTILKGIIEKDVKASNSCIDVPYGNNQNIFTPEGTAQGDGITTRFDYFEYPDSANLFTAPTTITCENDSVNSFFIMDSGNLTGAKNSTALGSTAGKSWSVGGTASIGLDPIIVLSSTSIGGNFDYSRSSSEGRLTMIDLDGDGLTDKVFKDGDYVYYRKQITDNNGNMSFGNRVLIEGAEKFMYESGDNVAWGLQASAGASFSGSWPSSESITSVYFTDVNADGLPDIVTDEGVLFNSLVNGVPKFTNTLVEQYDNSANTNPNVVTTGALGPCGEIIFDGQVDEDIACGVKFIYDTTLTFFMKVDSAVMAQAIENFAENRANYGYHYMVDLTGSDDLYRIIFYKKKISCEQTLRDPDVDAVRVWVAPRAGTIRVISDINLIDESLTINRQQSRYVNGVRYSIEFCRLLSYANQYYLDPPYSNTLLDSMSIGKDDYSHKRDTSYIEVSAKSIIFFRLQSKGNRDFDNVNWIQDIRYVETSAHGVEIDDHFNSSNDFLVTGLHTFQAPEEGRIYGNFQIKTGNLNGEYFRFKFGYDTSNVALSVTTDLVNNMNTTVSLTPRSVAQYATLNSYLISNLPKYDPLWSKVEIIPTIYFIPDVMDTIKDTIIYHPDVNMWAINQLGTDRLDTVLYGLFGPLYRGWGQFGYRNDTNSTYTELIDVSSLKREFQFFSANDEDEITTSIEAVPTGTYDKNVVLESYETQNMYNPLSLETKWVNMNPSSQYQAWIGYGNINNILKNKMTNTRYVDFYALPEVQDIPDFDHPVPVVANTNIGPKTVRKINTSNPQSYSFSTTFVAPISVGTSYSKSDNQIITDYIDLNGDRYPDILGEVKVQYTKPWGGIGTLEDLTLISEGISVNQSESHGVNFGGSYPIASRTKSSSPRNSKMSTEGSGNSGLNFGEATDVACFNFMDVNGDGLPDKVTKNGAVYLNLGYKFLASDNWRIPTIREGSSINGGTSIGGNFNIGQASISGGSSIGISQNKTVKMLMDFNGDGLPDVVSKGSNGNIVVKYNLGNGTYSSGVTYFIQANNCAELSYGTSFNESMNLGVNVGFTWGFAKIGVGISGSPYNRSFSKDKVQWVDINGDGAVDYVTSDEEGTMVVRYNNAKKVNMLKKVTNFSGSTVELNYSMPNSSFESPQRSWVLDTVKTYDPYSPVGGNATLTTFEYQHPNYNRFERTGYGYDTVITRIYSDGTTNNLYKVIVQGYNNSSYLKKGKKISESIFDGNMNPYIESLYEVAIVDQNGAIIEDDGCPKMAFPVRTCEITNYFEGQTQVVITTKKCVVYDSKRNIIAYTNEVDSSDYIVDDDITALITYKQGVPNNMLSLVENIQVYDAGNNLIRERSATYDNNGKMLSLSLNNFGTFIQSDFEYDIYGNMIKMIFPENLHQQRLFYEYEYDPILNALPTKVTSALGYVSRAEYDYVWQKPLSTFDINGQEMRYEYDIRGRNIKITGPNEIASGAPYTIRMEYHPVNVGRWDIMNPSTDTFSYARTFHYDVQNPNDPIQTTLLADGLGRVIQTKKDIEENGVQKMQVSGRVVYDAFGRVLAQYLPEVEVLNRDSIYNYTYTANTKTTTLYDIMDRETEITIPGNIKTYMNYGIDYDINNNLRFLTTTIDPLGNRTKTYTDPRKLQTFMIVDSTKITQFLYNAIGELIQTIDPDDHATEYGYTMLGQKNYRSHPDAGVDFYTFDNAGNLIQRSTQDLSNNNMLINYDYNYNQMISIQYPKNPEHNVNYYYGDNSASNNCIGRVYAIEDASGRQEFVYGYMGEVVKHFRTFVLPNELNTYTFKMGFEYDSWNRIISSYYPDGERVTYFYNKGGQLKNMKSIYNGQSYNYINSIKYNKFEKRTLIVYGNGTRAEYTYDTLQRLTKLRSISNSGIMQDIEYGFDNVNNIKFIKNSATTLANGLGGIYKQNYKYDNMYRLKNSDGNWQGLTYELDMTYSDDGRILTKNQTGTTLLYGQLSYFSYQNNYTYNVYKHTLDNITDTNDVQNFEYDANGNLIHHNINTQNLTNDRTLCWDEENRLMSVIDNNYTSYYVYDNANERTFKLTGTNSLMNINGNWMNYALLTNPTLYTSPYLVANNQGYSKHYYAGSERIATSIGKGGLEGITKPLVLKTFHGYWKDKATALNKVMDRTLRGCGGIQYSCKGDLSHLYDLEHNSPYPMEERYFYHPDHLGSSSWITDRNGQAIQHLHYLPYGEDWIAQRNTSWTTPYTFSGKEKDVETGYGYFGARYYDSGLSIWLSVDPMSDKYPSMSPYNYCANNPMKLIDPNGMEIDEAAGPKDPPNSLHPNRDTFFDPKDDNQRNTQSSPQSGSKSTNNNNQSGNTDNSNTSSSTSNSNSQNSSQSDNNQGKQSPAHSITIGGVACIYGGVSLDIGVIWDKKDVAFFICGGVCSGYDLSLGGQYTRYNNMKSAEGKGDVLEVGLLFLNYAHLPRAGNGVGASTSPSFSVTGRKTYSMILKPDIKSYGETISIFGHTTR